MQYETSYVPITVEHYSATTVDMLIKFASQETNHQKSNEDEPVTCLAIQEENRDHKFAEYVTGLS